MIYTITLNPSLDYIVNVDELNLGKVNRTSSEMLFAGGKGINVSILLAELGVKSIATGFVAGFTGNQIIQLLESQGCKTDFIKLPHGLSRINIKLKADTETEINAQGPEISQEYFELMLKKLDTLSDGDVLVLAGNAPASLGSNIYAEIIDRVANKDVLTIVDACGEQLTNAIKQKPFLIKPNRNELSSIFGVKIETLSEIKHYARLLCQMGAQNVIVSLDEMGGLLIDEKNEYYCNAKPITVVNSTGAGDSLVAGFIAKFLECEDCEIAFKYGIASGTASASCKHLPTKALIEELYQ